MRETPEDTLLTIAETVSNASNIPIEELPPLSHSINPEGLMAIVEDAQSHDVTITFSYAGQKVLVHSDNTIYVSPIKNDKIDQ